jgi:hypothetical protein
MDKKQLDKVLGGFNAEGQNPTKIEVNPSEGQGLAGGQFPRNPQTGNLSAPHKRGSADIALDPKLPDGQYRATLDDGKSAVRKI